MASCKKLAYAAGVFSGVSNGGSIDADMNGTTFGARVFAHPFRGSNTAVRDLGLGVAGTVGGESGLLSSFKTPAQTKFFSYGKGAVADGQREGRNGAFGALELVARYGALRVDDSAFPLFANPQTAAQQASAFAVGFNWYPARYTKFSTNFERSWFSHTVPNGKLHPENAVLTRLHLAF